MVLLEGAYHRQPSLFFWKSWTSDEDFVGTELLPIAVLFEGDVVCLDHRDTDRKDPTICVWNHEKSSDLAPCNLFYQ